MNPGGTALAFLLAGVSLWIQAATVSRRLRALGMACAGVVILLALFRLGGYLLAWDGGPDQLLFRGEARAGGPAHRPSQPDGTQHGGGHRCWSAWRCCSWT